MPPMLILFDVDGTLLLTKGVGRAAMREAGQSLFGEHFTLDGVNLAGNLDPLIWRAAAAQSSVEDTPEHLAAFRSAYAARLAVHLETAGVVWSLPGAAELVAALAANDSVTLGLLTGNWPETGRGKLEAAGYDLARFPVRVWGDDGPVRAALPPVGMARCGLLRGAGPSAEDVLIIGDTPHDIECARAHGCRVLAVATGQRHSLAELSLHRPDHVVKDFSQTDALLEWILAIRRPNVTV